MVAVVCRYIEAETVGGRRRQEGGGKEEGRIEREER